MIKLSKAIREGAKLRPMGTGDYFEVDDPEYPRPTDGLARSCALGAAFEALTGAISRTAVTLTIEHQWPVLAEWRYERPRTGPRYTLSEIIVHMNDDRPHCFTCESIADWLESIGL